MQKNSNPTYADLGQSLNFAPELSKAIAALGFTSPTPIQNSAIPIAMNGHDLIGNAQTGTGKTAAFCVPIFQQLLKDEQSMGLILAPTRELVQQIETLWRGLTRFMPRLRHACLIGGVSMEPQYRALRDKPRLIVATPGRLLDHARRRSVDLRRVQILVLDEADRMLDMGFAPQLNEILKLIPQHRQTMLFSATWAPEVDKLASRYLRKPERVAVGEVSKPTAQVTQEILRTEVRRKNDAVLDQINAREGSILIFARTKHRTDRLATYLDSYGLEVGRIHGGRTQMQRTKALESFRRGKIRILVATDIAARGIDVPEIGHVINYDMPQQAEDYVHRIGRAGRAGATGMALSIVTPEDRGVWREIERIIKKSGGTMPNVLAESTTNKHETPKELTKVESKEASAEKPLRRERDREPRREPGHERRERRSFGQRHERGQQKTHERSHERSHERRREPRREPISERGRDRYREHSRGLRTEGSNERGFSHRNDRGNAQKDQRRSEHFQRAGRPERSHRNPDENGVENKRHSKHTHGHESQTQKDDRFKRRFKKRFAGSKQGHQGFASR